MEAKQQKNDSQEIADIFGQLNDVTIDSDELGFDINLDDIGAKSKQSASDLIENLSKLYCNEEFMSSHPTFKRRVDSELESLMLLFKMRRADDIVQENLIKAIASNSKNASLYKALADLQKTILSISSKIDDSIKNLNTFIKGYQLEIEFNDNTDAPVSNASSDEEIENVTRGSRDYITKMREDMEREILETSDDYNSDNE